MNEMYRVLVADDAYKLADCDTIAFDFEDKGEALSFAAQMVGFGKAISVFVPISSGEDDE